MDERMQVDEAVDNLVTLTQVTSRDAVQRLLKPDEGGAFELPVGRLLLRCHVDLFGSGTVTVKRIEFTKTEA
ncbi:MAG: hypothetical protein ACJ790_20425 [Myxococcaceae bacterium]